MNRYELDLAIARDMDEAVLEAEKNGVKKMKDKIKGCILYKYLKTKKDKAAEQLVHSSEPLIGKKYDKYIKLKCAYLKMRRAPDNKKFVEEYIAVYRKIMGKAPGSDIDKAQSEAEDELLADIVSDHVCRFTKIVSADKGSGTNDIARELKDIPKTADNIDPVELYDAFLRAKNKKVTASHSAESSDEHIKKCEELYDLMRRDKRFTSAYVQLYSDPSNGAGVYLIGRGYFEEKDSQAFRNLKAAQHREVVR